MVSFLLPLLAMSGPIPALGQEAPVQPPIATSIGRQVYGPWARCSVQEKGIETLVTTVTFHLKPDGSFDHFISTSTAGITEENQPSVERHQECARKAIRLASPFTGLPPEHYDYWQNYEFKFQKR